MKEFKLTVFQFIKISILQQLHKTGFYQESFIMERFRLFLIVCKPFLLINLLNKLGCFSQAKE